MNLDPLILLRSQMFMTLSPPLHKFLDLLLIAIMMSVFLLNKPYGIVLQASLHKNNKDKLDRHRNIPNSPQRARYTLVDLLKSFKSLFKFFFIFFCINCCSLLYFNDDVWPHQKYFREGKKKHRYLSESRRAQQVSLLLSSNSTDWQKNIVRNIFLFNSISNIKTD